MPRHVKRTVVARRMWGRGKLGEWLRNAGQRVNSWLKSTKALSRAGDFALQSGLVPPQYRAMLGSAVDLAKSKGYGRRRRVTAPYLGQGLRLAGGSLRLAGARSW